MTTHDDDNLDAFITAYLLYLDGEGPRPDPDDLGPEDRPEAAARITLLEAGSPAPVPDGAADRIARGLGFDRVGTRITLSGTKFKRVRQQRGLDLKTIAGDASAAGVSVRTGDLLRLETSEGTPFDQEIVSVLAAILYTTVEDLESDFEAEVSAVQAFLNSARFDELLAEWLAEHDHDPDEIRNYVTDGVLATSYRAEDVTEDHLVELVHALLRRLER